MLKKLFSLFAALTLSVGLWAQAVGDQFVDATSGLKFEVTAVGETNTVKVTFNNDYTGSTCTVPATVSYNDVTFNVTEIGGYAFDGCSALQSVTLSEGLMKIGSYAFGSCSNLQSPTFPASLITIDDYAFSFCFAVTFSALTISASVTEIGTGAFLACSSLASVTFEGNACQEGINESAFAAVGSTTPATLILPANWTGSKPIDNKTAWHGGWFNLAAPAPTVDTVYIQNLNDVAFNPDVAGNFILSGDNVLYSAIGDSVYLCSLSFPGEPRSGEFHHADREPVNTYVKRSVLTPEGTPSLVLVADSLVYAKISYTGTEITAEAAMHSNYSYPTLKNTIYYFTLSTITTALEDIVPSAKIRKMLIDGQVVIYRDETWFDLKGRKL